MFIWICNTIAKDGLTSISSKTKSRLLFIVNAHFGYLHIRCISLGIP